ncbi:MAG: DUF4393 domain-containing protein [Symploca sp. SIO1B1]|nr:DUF4393 domain-containing protein [Symploca sp. SIO2D2]NER51043.1 DUF4393 domain-containing protein [Symploca sp. SIO1A3]NER94984.1 DUF4393 domain-containing protein [Symploca sp. SIO1B1]
MSNIPEVHKELSETGIDITGIGKAMKAIPPSAWQQMVDTACTTVEKVLSPITETAHGIGRLIKAKFDRLIEVEQVMAAESIASAQRKVQESGQPIKMPRPQILLQVIENTSSEVDCGVRELWSNLLAQEMITQSIHPEIGRILSRLSFEDAQLLVAITEAKPNKWTQMFSETVTLALTAAFAIHLNYEPQTFNHAHLQNLGLIERHEGKWKLTILGEGFIKAVTDPSIRSKQNA